MIEEIIEGHDNSDPLLYELKDRRKLGFPPVTLHPSSCILPGRKDLFFRFGVISLWTRTIGKMKKKDRLRVNTINLSFDGRILVETIVVR